MNTPNDSAGKGDAAAVSPAVQEALRAADSAASAFDPGPPPDRVAEGQALGGAGNGPLGPGRVSLVDPEACGRALGRLGRMLERAGCRRLYGSALVASKGDKQFASGIVSDWAWSDDDWHEIDGLLGEVVALYGAQQYVRPDVALALASAVHVAGYMVTLQQVRKQEQRVAPDDKQPTSNGSQ